MNNNFFRLYITFPIALSLAVLTSPSTSTQEPSGRFRSRVGQIGAADVPMSRFTPSVREVGGSGGRGGEQSRGADEG